MDAALTEPESSVTLFRKSSIAPELFASAFENVSALPIVLVSGPRTSVTKPWMSVMALLARSIIWSAVASRLVTLDWSARIRACVPFSIAVFRMFSSPLWPPLSSI
ncbi:hypothetical protein D3C71_2000090 [compost metagenome]